VSDFAFDVARALNHDSVELDHLILGMLHFECPGAARVVLASFGVHAEVLRQAFIDSRGDPYETKPRGVRLGAGTQRFFERAYVEAVLLADAEVASEHVLLAVTRGWDGVRCDGVAQAPRDRLGCGAPAGGGGRRRGRAARAASAA